MSGPAASFAGVSAAGAGGRCPRRPWADGRRCGHSSSGCACSGRACSSDAGSWLRSQPGHASPSGSCTGHCCQSGHAWHSGRDSARRAAGSWRPGVAGPAGFSALCKLRSPSAACCPVPAARLRSAAGLCPAILPAGHRLRCPCRRAGGSSPTSAAAAAEPWRLGRLGSVGPGGTCRGCRGPCGRGRSQPWTLLARLARRDLQPMPGAWLPAQLHHESRWARGQEVFLLRGLQGMQRQRPLQPLWTSSSS
mmetsp:Transcript_5945/g.10792  ORF Transcript_5945/g.10792 Transcript_5945/m.10792 type:complete len:250 (-) Transcript_5945:337-1086(-)